MKTSSGMSLPSIVFKPVGASPLPVSPAEAGAADMGASVAGLAATAARAAASALLTKVVAMTTSPSSESGASAVSVGTPLEVERRA